MNAHASGRTITQATSRAIFDDALCAYQDPAHPCHHFRWLQAGVSDDSWQLPEPFNGHSANSGIVFLGLNPSYDPSEDVPTIRSSFEQWDGYYRARFDREISHWHKLYRRYQTVGEMATSPGFRLGVDGMVLEVVRFRSASARGCSDAVLEHELPTTRRLLSELAPRVIVANGATALRAVQALWPEARPPIPTGAPLLAIEHQCFWIRANWGRVAMIPTRHLSAAFGFRIDMLAALAGVVRSALEG